MKDYFSKEIGNSEGKDYFAEEVGGQPQYSQQMVDDTWKQAHPIVSGMENVANTIVNPLTQTLTGKSLQQRSLEAPVPTSMTGNSAVDAPALMSMFMKGLGRDAVGAAVDSVTSPLSVLGIIGKGAQGVAKASQVANDIDTMQLKKSIGYFKSIGDIKSAEKLQGNLNNRLAPGANPVLEGKYKNPKNNMTFNGNEDTQSVKNVLTARIMQGDLSGAQKAKKILDRRVALDPTVNNPLKHIMKFAKPKNRITLANNVENQIAKSKSELVDYYGDQYESIIGKSDKKIGIGSPVQKWMDDWAPDIMQNQEFVKAFQAGDPQAQKLYKIYDGITKNPGILSQEMSVQDADKLQKFIKDMPGIKGKLQQSYKRGRGQVDFTHPEAMLLDLANNIKHEVIQAHPEFGLLNKHYGDSMNAIRALRKGLGTGDNLIMNLRSFNKLGDFTRQAAESVLDKRTLKDIGDFSNADSLYNVLRAVGLSGAGGGSIGTGLKAIVR